MPEFIISLTAFARFWAARVATAVGSEEGSVAEKVVLVAIFVALAIAAGAIITTKVMNKATSINLG